MVKAFYLRSGLVGLAGFITGKSVMMRREGALSRKHDIWCTCAVLEERLIGKLARMKVDSWVFPSRCISRIIKQCDSLHISAS